MQAKLQNSRLPVILMADIVGSSRRDARALMKDFDHIVKAVNQRNRKQILSPLTITLGDEFQGVIGNLRAALNVVLDLEELTLSAARPFRLRYALVEGEIQTPINRDIAHGMLGPGLTEARQRLGDMKSTRSRFDVEIEDKDRGEDLRLLFTVFQGIRDQWTQAQLKIVAAFIKFGDYKKVAAKLKRDPTAAWRRKKSLMIEEFEAVKKLILNTAAR
jgi:hypothetical protein